jgi:hypothetical protein
MSRQLALGLVLPYNCGMATKTVHHLIDDLDGSNAVTTVTFGWEGRDYEIDLNEKNQEKFEKAIKPFMEVARRAARSGKAATAPKQPGTQTLASRYGYDTSAIREWAMTQPEIDINERGRIPDAVVEQYHVAQQEAASGTPAKKPPRKSAAKKAAPAAAS